MCICLVKVGIYGPDTVAQVKHGSNMQRGIEAHPIIYIFYTQYSMVMVQFFENNLELTTCITEQRLTEFKEPLTKSFRTVLGDHHDELLKTLRMCGL